MKKEDKNIIIDELTSKIKEYSHFYLTDISCLNAEDTSNLRRKCFEKEIELMVVKNTLLKKALERIDGEKYEQIYDSLNYSTSIMFTNTGNVPAKLIKEFRRKKDKPILKAAFVEESVYVGDNLLDALVNLKSRDELIADVIALLQSPVRTVMSQLQSGGQKLSGILKTLSEK